jgi:hypothetical protein
MARDVGNKGQMIGCLPIRIAARSPPADPTVPTGLTGRNLRRLARESSQPPLCNRVVVREIGNPQRDPFTIAQLDVHFGRRAALLAADQSRKLVSWIACSGLAVRVSLVSTASYLDPLRLDGSPTRSRKSA